MDNAWNDFFIYLGVQPNTSIKQIYILCIVLFKIPSIKYSNIRHN